MASTTLSIGNAIGLAVLIAIANGHAAGQTTVAHAAAVAEGIRLAFWLAAGGIVLSLLAALTFPRKTIVADHWNSEAEAPLLGQASPPPPRSR